MFFAIGRQLTVPKMIIRAPVNIPARRPKRSLTGPVRNTAGMDPMLYRAKTKPVDEPA
jgi:hypothetical protein